MKTVVDGMEVEMSVAEFLELRNARAEILDMTRKAVAEKKVVVVQQKTEDNKMSFKNAFDNAIKTPKGHLKKGEMSKLRRRFALSKSECSELVYEARYGHRRERKNGKTMVKKHPLQIVNTPKDFKSEKHKAQIEGLRRRMRIVSLIRSENRGMSMKEAQAQASEQLRLGRVSEESKQIPSIRTEQLGFGKSKPQKQIVLNFPVFRTLGDMSSQLETYCKYYIANGGSMTFFNVGKPLGLDDGRSWREFVEEFMTWQGVIVDYFGVHGCFKKDIGVDRRGMPICEIRYENKLIK